MLTHLHIENYALIRETAVDFEPGFVAITGETGAGKSIMLGALGLLLGQRADSAVLADKERKCVVEAQFSIAGFGLEALFAEADVDYDDHLILRREILPAGKSRAFANDTPVQLAFLRALGPHILDIHSQNQTLALGESSFRLDLLDALSATPAPLAAYREAYAAYVALKRELEQLTATEAQNRREQDYLQFQHDELRDAHLVADEQQSLEQESQLLAHAEAVREGLSVAAAAIDDDSEASTLSRLRQAKQALTHIAAYHPAVQPLLERVESALIELDDVDAELQSTAEAVSYSPDRQQQVDDRLALLYRLQKKHGVDSVEALIAIRDDLDRRLQSIATLDERIQTLMEQVDGAFDRLQQAADALSAARREAGAALSQAILPLLHQLGMPEARFETVVNATPDYGPHGHDSVVFLFNANRGAELRDISRVASGGEMSRLMLAIKAAQAIQHSPLSTHKSFRTLILDEIDTGVSGDISVAVARIMGRMAETTQVVAITHLPQIAARAAQHLKVYKQADTDSTVSRIRQLTPDERIVELAVMLSSDPPTPAALQTARELMAR